MLHQQVRQVNKPEVELQRSNDHSIIEISFTVAEKVLLAVLLAPVIDPSTMRSPIKHLAKLSTLVRRGFQSFGSEEFLPHWPLIKNLITCPWLQSVYAIM